MKLRFLLMAAAALASVPAAAQTVERIPETTPSLILRGVKVSAGSDLFILSGLVAPPIDPAKTATPADFGDTRRQTEAVLGRIRETLQAQGYEMSDVVKLTVFLVGDPGRGGAMDFAGMNEGFKQLFGTAQNPQTTARSVVQVVALASPNHLVEIEAIAAKAPRR
ncbi:enamine deaminase RidA (YjgF/YER057c/UK114 family) [Novosphingobium chloroacetimidivorans]|uniref:Enamine deaminase RidA (YjgF/YER057c/UK114 family) n=1 Tax=Novosphingobium chloroacetimidivorans TaxID=1428314 RepID=A0A7W7NWA4_9SPHN|nr:RidA family protein [Novosphingobium chloroacetimidivorans]MBB4857960.1 enamine deaminase RidA (YjgF/YER057c/UK114 family) [Novosphingobium chloroacetimidivorans]